MVDIKKIEEAVFKMRKAAEKELKSLDCFSQVRAIELEAKIVGFDNVLELFNE